MRSIDAIDLQIIDLLKKDAKMSIKELASVVGITKTPIYERIKRLEEEGIIKKYIAVIDEKKLGDYMIVFCSVSLEEQKLQEINEFRNDVKKFTEVLECYLMGGGEDFLLKVKVKNLDDYHQFSSGKLAALNNVKHIKSTFVLNVVKNNYE